MTRAKARITNRLCGRTCVGPTRWRPIPWTGTRDTTDRTGSKHLRFLLWMLLATSLLQGGTVWHWPRLRRARPGAVLHRAADGPVLGALLLRRLLPLLVSGALSACAASGRLPEDVLRFMERRDVCDHLRGEFSGDPESDKDRIEMTNQACAGTDRQLAALLARYRHHQRVLEALGKYERSSIESSTATQYDARQ